MMRGRGAGGWDERLEAVFVLTGSLYFAAFCEVVGKACRGLWWLRSSRPPGATAVMDGAALVCVWRAYFYPWRRRWRDA